MFKDIIKIVIFNKFFQEENVNGEGEGVQFEGLEIFYIQRLSGKGDIYKREEDQRIRRENWDGLVLQRLRVRGVRNCVGSRLLKGQIS